VGEDDTCYHKIITTAHFMHDPGMHTFPNGDPSYPPTRDAELEAPDGKNGKVYFCPDCGASWDNDECYEQLVEQAIDQAEEPE
jgi:hypothetical protein